MSDEVVKDAIDQTRHDLEELLAAGRQQLEDLGDQFLNQGIGLLCRGLLIYSELFKRSGYEDRHSLEQAVGKSNRAVKEAAQNLLDTEADWSDFLRVLEAKDVSENEKVLSKVGDKISGDIILQSVTDNALCGGSTSVLSCSNEMEAGNVKLNETVTLGSLLLGESQDELKAAGCHVVVVTFGEMSGAERWLQETKCPFPYYTNPSCTLYKALGVRRSVESVWNATTLSYYGGKLAKGEPLPQAYTDIEDDPHQMGGDFLLNAEGKLIFVYRSKVPTDRPSTNLILAALNDLNCNL